MRLKTTTGAVAAEVVLRLDVHAERTAATTRKPASLGHASKNADQQTSWGWVISEDDTGSTLAMTIGVAVALIDASRPDFGSRQKRIESLER